MDIPKRIPTSILDRITNRLRSTSDMMLQLELEFPDNSIDVPRLARAFAIVLDAEPILGYRFVQHWRRPYWERRTRGKPEVLSVAKDEQEYEAFRITSIDTYRGPQIMSCLWQSPTGDRLIIKVAHEVADLNGLKEIARVVSHIYARLADDPDYHPEPNVKTSRGLWQVVRHVPLYVHPKIFLAWLQAHWSFARHPATHALRIPEGPRDSLVFFRRVIGEDRCRHIVDYGREHGATINDMMLAALFRSYAAEGRWNQKRQLRVTMTVDLRRYLPAERRAVIANLSTATFGSPNIGRNLGADFSSTLSLVTACTQRLKKRWVGLSDFVGIGIIRTLPLGERLLHNILEWGAKRGGWPTLANAGKISQESVTFETPPARAWIFQQPCHPPALFLCITGYGGKLTLTTSAYPTQRAVAERIFDRILSELPE